MTRFQDRDRWWRHRSPASSAPERLDAYLAGACFRSQLLLVGFAWDAYRGYRPAVLAGQLEALAALLWSRYRRSCLEIVTSWADADEPAAPSDEAREPNRRLEHLEVSGRSAGGRVAKHSRALVSWQVSVADDAIAALSEQDFVAELHDAVTATTMPSSFC